MGAVIIGVLLLVGVSAVGPAAADVFLYADRSSGTWQHGEFGGHVYGRIQEDRRIVGARS